MKRNRGNRGAKHSQKAGKAPGTLVYTGTQTGEKAELTLIKYNLQEHTQLVSTNLQEILAAIEPDKVNWLNISNLEDVQLVASIGEHFGLHALVLEDVVNVDQMPKVQDFGDYSFSTLKMISINKEDR